jgi:hypothetical protein
MLRRSFDAADMVLLVFGGGHEDVRELSGLTMMLVARWLVVVDKGDAADRTHDCHLSAPTPSWAIHVIQAWAYCYPLHALQQQRYARGCPGLAPGWLLDLAMRVYCCPHPHHIQQTSRQQCRWPGLLLIR